MHFTITYRKHSAHITIFMPFQTRPVENVGGQSEYK